MEKTFNRSTAREISQKIQEVLSSYCKDWDYELTIGNGRFSADKLNLNLEVRIKSTDGTTVVSHFSHTVADSAASRAGLKFQDHLIHSVWNVKGDTYVVVGYTTKRPKYPLSLKRNDGQLSKAPIGFLSQGHQITRPTLEEFTKWFTLDPDSDAILETDAEICDNVQEFMDAYYNEELKDDLYNLINTFIEEGIAGKWAKRAYELLFLEGGSIKSAYHGLRTIYSELKK